MRKKMHVFEQTSETSRFEGRYVRLEEEKIT
jgi:hypothetical protein